MPTARRPATFPVGQLTVDGMRLEEEVDIRLEIGSVSPGKFSISILLARLFKPATGNWQRVQRRIELYELASVGFARVSVVIDGQNYLQAVSSQAVLAACSSLTFRCNPNQPDMVHVEFACFGNRLETSVIRSSLGQLVAPSLVAQPVDSARQT